MKSTPATVKKTFTLRKKEILDHNLKIEYNVGSKVLILWSKFQLFAYKDFNFEEGGQVLNPDLIVQRVLLLKDYIVCFDASGTYTIKKLFSDEKWFTGAKNNQVITYCPVENNTFVTIKPHFTEKGVHLGDYCYHQNTLPDLQGSTSMRPVCFRGNVRPELMVFEKTIMKLLPISPKQGPVLLAISGVTVGSHIFIATFDSRTLYLGMLQSNSEVVALHKLYTTASEISDFFVEEDFRIEVVVGLKSGTIMRITLMENIQISYIHLNTSILRFYNFDKVFLYTDGQTMWKASRADKQSTVKFRQYFLCQVRDFVMVDKQIFAFTYNGICYAFPIYGIQSYLTNEKDTDFIPAYKVIEKAGTIQELLTRVESNNDILLNIDDEFKLIAAFCMGCNDELRDVVMYHVVVNNKESVIGDKKTDCLLTEDLSKYFEGEPDVFHITVEFKKIDELLKIIYFLTHHLTFHFTFCYKNEVIKTTSASLPEDIFKMTYIIPVNFREKVSEMTVKIRLIAELPGTLNNYTEKPDIYMVISKEDINVNSIQFINEPGLLAIMENNKDMLVAKHMERFSNEFSFANAEDVEYTNECVVNLALLAPPTYKKSFQDLDLYTKHMSLNRAMILKEKLQAPQFLGGHCEVTLHFGNHKVDIRLVNVNETNSLIISSTDMKLAVGVRMFLSAMLYSEKDYEEGKGKVANAMITGTLAHIRDNLTKHEQHEQLTDVYLAEVISRLSFDVLQYVHI